MEIAFIEATRECFMTEKAREALELFSRSSRIKSDIEDAKKYSFSVSIIIREWSQMKAEMEFRCFFFKKKLTGFIFLIFFYVFNICFYLLFYLLFNFNFIFFFCLKK